MADNGIKFELIKGSRENSEFLYCVDEKQLFRRKNIYKQKNYYTCIVERCDSRIEVVAGTCRKTKNFKNHCHGDSEKIYKELLLKNKIKDECKSKTASKKTIRSIFYSECENNQAVAKNLNFDQMRRSLTFIRQNVYPRSPKSGQEIIQAFENPAVMEAIGKSKHTETYVFYKGAVDTPEYSFCIFASESIIANIKNYIAVDRRNFYMDATFSIVPVGLYTQFLIVYVEYIEQVFPFIYVLMSRKTQECYKSVFKFIHDNVFPLTGSSFMTDFEKAMRNSLKQIYPEADFYNCWFHFSQAIRRKCASYKDFFQQIKKNERAVKCYLKIRVLPLLPAKDILEAYNLIKSEINCLPEKNVFENFLKYFEKQWLNKETPETISVFKHCIRTTSALEAYNGVLGKKLIKKGNFYKFIKAIRDEEFIKSTEFVQFIESGGASRSNTKKKKYIISSNKIAESSDLYETKKITIHDFLNRLVYLDNNEATINSIFNYSTCEEFEEVEEDSPSDTVPEGSPISNTRKKHA